MLNYLRQKLSHNKEKRDLRDSVENLLEQGTVNSQFILLTVIASLIATLGILMNNGSILIGAMLIAPLLVPVIGLSVGVGSGSLRLIGHSLKALTLGFTLSLLSAMAITWLVGPGEINQEIYANFSNTFLYALVALLSGVVAVYSWFKPKMNQIIPGVAIAVALVPPIAFAGTVLVVRDQRVFIDVLQVIFINLGGIFMGGLLTFILFAIFSKRPTHEVGKQVDSEVEKKEK